MVAVTVVNVDQVRGMPEVDFDFGVSAGLRERFRAVQAAVVAQRGSRLAYRRNAQEDFAGFFSRVFLDNGDRQLADLDDIATTLGLVDARVGELEVAARTENARRRQAREWAQRMTDRSDLHKAWDALFGTEDPPVSELDDSGPSQSVSALAPRRRETPTPGGGGADGGATGGGGTTSARPASLRSFAVSTRGADAELAGRPGSLLDACTQFASRCRWATLDASSVVSGLSAWLTANGEDARWADVVASAFEKAGGSGELSTLPDSSIAAALAAQGVAPGRTDIQVDPPVAFGSPPTTGYSNDPVNTATGNFLENEVDLAFGGPASVLALTRCYNSLDGAGGSLGPGWSAWPDAALALGDDGARVRLPDGRQIVFPRQGEGWARATGENLWLERAVGGYVMRSSWGLRHEFDRVGRLVATGSGPGTRILLERDAAGRLLRLVHEFGRWIALHWRADRLTGAEASDGRRVSYEYDRAGRLVAARAPGGVRHYGWNTAGLIDRVVDADGVVEAANTYDDRGRVVLQRSSFGRTTRFSYLADGVTVASDEDGSRANTWITDRRGRLVGVIDAADRRQSTAFDGAGNPVLVTERDGSVTVNEYDGRGRRVMSVTPAGARLAWAWDDADRVVSASVEQAGQVATTVLTYSGAERNPSEVLDAEGGVTAMRWRDGLLTEVVDPTGVRVAFTHDERGDLVATTDGAGNVARLVRDHAGRVVAAITPLGNRTTYAYDERTGCLAARTDPTGAVWRYERSEAGRVTGVVDPLGGRTAMEHGDHGRLERTVDPLGRAVASRYDDLGNPASVELPDGSAWEFGYDHVSRLVSATDAGGGGWAFRFGPTGYLTGTVDATGVERTIETTTQGWPTLVADGEDTVGARYDRLGRLVASTAADGTQVVRRHDRCGRLVEVVDAAGGVTRYQRDAAGRVVAVTQPMGQTFRYEYDACGRWAATVSTGGDRYEIVRDADGRIVGERWPTGEQVRTGFDAAGRIVSKREPGRGLTRFTWDAAGRLTRVRDPWYGTRRFVWDAAGQLVAATNSLGQVSRFEYDGLGRQVAVVDPLGGRTTRTFDRMNRLTSQTDPLGRTTRYTHDAAGRPATRREPDGTSLAWAYDGSGRLERTLAGDRVLGAIERDFAGRRMRITGADSVVELAWDPVGNLTRRTRDGVGPSWAYDTNGRRTSLTHPDGSVTRYSYDENNRASVIEHPGLGRAVLERDRVGRIVSLSADGLHVTWEWADGAVVRQEVNRRGFLSSTRIERDAEGRVAAQTTDGVRTAFTYDAAGQLVETRTSEGALTAYAWDAGGRLTSETTAGRVTRYAHDAAGQLLSRRDPDGRLTEYSYDGAGRRTREAGPAGERLFSWDPRGYLTRMTELTHEGDTVQARSRALTVDGLGELAAVDGTPVYWDSANRVPVLAQVGSAPVVAPGGGAAWLGADAGAAWIAPDWQGRGSGAPPWSAPPASGSGQGGMAVHARAGLVVDGMEWMSARLYDPSSRGFLSTDPLAPVTAAGWAGNPYSYAGNDPVNMTDPWGLRPVSEADLQAYRDSNNGMLGSAVAAASGWVADNWEYIAAGALIVAGVAVMCTGIGGPIGAAMIAGAAMGAGGSIWSQKSDNGSVDWGRVAVDGIVGGVTGLAGGGAAAAAARATSGVTSCLSRNILTGAVEGAADGGVSGGLQYLTSGQPVTVSGLVSATGQGAAGGAVLGGAGGGLADVSGVARYGCFEAGTPVLMADGSSRPIQDVVVGDEVMAFNPESGVSEPRHVVDTFVHEEVATLRLTTSAGTIVSTVNHPFYVEGRGWTPAGELEASDLLRAPEGARVDVVSIQSTGKSQNVHNLRVEGVHNYFVQTSAGAWVLVHNSDGPCTTEDLYAFGNRSAPRPARPRQDFRVADETAVVGPYSPASATDPVFGASTFTNPLEVPLTGHFHRLPAGTQLPDGFAVHADGSDVGGRSSHGHRTIYPTEPMTVEQFTHGQQSLPWEHARRNSGR